MVILSKKRILLITTCIFISIFSFMYFNSRIQKETLPTVSLPVSNKVIVIDAGHGIPDERSSI